MAVMRLGKSLRALIAAEPLITLPVFPKFLALSLAIVARHFDFTFLRGKPIIALRSALRLTPRADLAPFSVDAEGGAFLLHPYSVSLQASMSR